MAAPGDLADGPDRVLIGFEIALPVGEGASRLAEHVEARGEAGILLLPHPPDRLADGSAHDEDLAHQPHRRAYRLSDERLAGPGKEALQGAGLLALADQGSADHQPPGRRIDQGRVRLALVRAPVRIAELVGDQLVGRLRVRHAQEGLGERQEGDALRRVEPIFLEELVDPARRLGGAKLAEHRQRPFLDPLPRIGVEGGVAKQGLQHLRFRRPVKLPQFRARGCRSVRHVVSSQGLSLVSRCL